jgi:hypothetical protein
MLCSVVLSFGGSCFLRQSRQSHFLHFLWLRMVTARPILTKDTPFRGDARPYVCRGARTRQWSEHRLPILRFQFMSASLFAWAGSVVPGPVGLGLLLWPPDTLQPVTDLGDLCRPLAYLHPPSTIPYHFHQGEQFWYVIMEHTERILNWPQGPVVTCMFLIVGSIHRKISLEIASFLWLIILYKATVSPLPCVSSGLLLMWV